MSEEKIKQFSEKATPVFEKYGVRYAGLFGSYARGEENTESDVDILIGKGDKPLSLLDFVRMKDELSKIFNKKVDIISDGAVVPYFREYIFKDLQPLYGKR
ncbi:MAG: nucleotidyltransferase family protein [Candidatus Parcubacteria bacterium]|nr:nucleotidyltransferase family protein [Candidatus Parcubacteria bacterium]